MEYLSTKYGLVSNEDFTTENGQLFLAELCQLTPEDKSLNEVMTQQLLNSKVKSGLYHRNPDLFDRRCMSHDNLSGIMSWSFSNNTEHAKEIWSYLLWHFGTYDNTQGKSSQLSRLLPFNPSNFFIWGLCAKSYIYLPFLIFYLPSLIICCNKPANNTTGKILSWLELTPHKNHWLCKHLHRYFEKKMKEQYGDDYIKGLMYGFHGGNASEFPILKVLGLKGRWI